MTLANRIIVSSVILIIVTGFGVGLYSLEYLNRTLQDEDSRWSAATAEAIAKAITTRTLEGDKVGVRDVLRRVQKTTPEIVYLAVVDFRGELFTSTFGGNMPETLTEPHVNCAPGCVSDMTINGEAVRDIAFPLIEGLDAHLHIGVDKGKFARSIRHAGTRILLLVLLITVAGSLVAVGIGRRLSRPIDRLTAALREYGQSHEEVYIPEADTTVREVSDLYRGFREMVNERQEAVAELARFRSALDQTLDCVFMFDADTLRFTYVNQGAMDQVGYSRDELLRMTPVDIKPDFDESTFRETIASCRDGSRRTLTFSTRHRHKDGHVIPVEIFLQYVDFSDQLAGSGSLSGRPLFLAIVRDISERIAAEENLRKLNAELEVKVAQRTAKLHEQATILDQIHDAVVTTDMQGNVTGWNHGAVRLFGYGTDEAMGRFVGFMYPEDQQSRLQDDVIGPLQAKGEHEMEVVMCRKDGRQFDAHLSLTLIHDETGKPKGMVGYSLDITDRKQAQRDMARAKEEAEEASRAKSAFLSRMSHELRTPMNAILGFSQLLEQNYEGNLSKDDLASISEIHKAGNHLLELINEVLDLSQVESGHLRLSLESLELPELVEECAALISPLAEKNGIRLHLPQDPGSVYVMGDRLRLKQVILNLLSNAVKYNRRGGDVRLAVGKTDSGWRLSVTDAGPGIPRALQSRVFEPFDRLHADQSRVEGTGIGLTLAKHLVQLMNGDIGFESDEGKGSTFWIDLPGSDVAPAHGYEVPIARGRKSATGELHNVLYVEDNPANLHLVSRLLTVRGGINLYAAPSALIARELISKHRFDLILLDIHLSGEEDGYDVLSTLQSDPGLRKIPVIAISAHATTQDIQDGLNAGFIDYLTKPLDINRLFAVMDLYLGENKLASEQNTRPAVTGG